MATIDSLRNDRNNGHVVHCEHACHCGCHRSPGAIHILPCCTVCPSCGGFVKDLDEHLEKCHAPASVS